MNSGLEMMCKEVVVILIGPFYVFAWKDLDKVQENSVRIVSVAALRFESVAHICCCFECDSENFLPHYFTFYIMVFILLGFYFDSGPCI